MRVAAESTSAVAAYPLIGAGDPAPYSIVNGDGRAPLLLVCDQAHTFPEALKPWPADESHPSSPGTSARLS
jgi:hypothetical protein